MQPKTILYYNPDSPRYHWFMYYPDTNSVTYHCHTVTGAMLAPFHDLEHEKHMQKVIFTSTPYPIHTTLHQDYPELFL